MDFLEGISVSDASALRDSGVDLNEFARRGATMFLDMIFRDGFYHADPHPGNFLISEEGDLIALDFGCMKEIPEEFYVPYFELAKKENIEAIKKWRSYIGTSKWHHRVNAGIKGTENTCDKIIKILQNMK